MKTYEEILERKRDDPIKILEISYTTTEDTKHLDWSKKFPKAILASVAVNENLVERDRNAVDKINMLMTRDECTDYDLLVLRGKYPQKDFEILRHFFYTVKQGGVALIHSDNFNPSYIENMFYDEETRKGVIFEYDDNSGITALSKPAKTLEEYLVPQKNVVISPDLPVMEGEEFVIVTSAVNCGKNFSVFYPEERFEQTLKTISSVREKIPSAKIILVEMSNLSQPRIDRFAQVCDLVILCFKNFGEGIDKHIGELFLLQEGFKAIPPNATHVYKMGGRGYLNEDFKLEKFRGEKMTFASDGEGRYNTKFYHIPNTCIETFTSLFCVLMWETSRYPCIERIFYEYLPQEDVEIVESIGYEIYTASDGSFSKT